MPTESTPGLLAWLRREFKFIFGRVGDPLQAECHGGTNQDKDHPATLFDFFNARGRAGDNKANKLTNDIERTLRRAVENQNWRNCPLKFQQVAKLTHDHYYEAVLIAILNCIAVTDKWIVVFKHLQLIEYSLRTGSRRHFYYTRSRINRIRQVVIKHPCRAGWSDASKQRIETQMRHVVRLVTEYRYTAAQSEPRRVWEPRTTDAPIQDAIERVDLVGSVATTSNTNAHTAIEPLPRNSTRTGSPAAAVHPATNGTSPPGRAPTRRITATSRPSINQGQQQDPRSAHASVPASADLGISPSTSVRTTSTAAASRRSRPSNTLSSARDSVAWLASVRGIEISPTEYRNYGHNPPSSADSSSSTHRSSTQASSISANSAREVNPGLRSIEAVAGLPDRIGSDLHPIKAV
ncbi:unnamed protein product [Clonostachys solani]|uniref:ENTH domain-containing protein n=1 Tax=Clonostachys solani TaxID=160281 RepID=A0A9N9Z195_9HYPO|nr:unnamed protein product [Clonostachys solani]